MKLYWIAIRLWAGTILLAAAEAGVYFFLPSQGSSIVLAAFIAFVAMLVSFPLLFPIAQVIRLSARIPYSIGGKMIWMTFMLALLEFIFFLLFFLIARLGITVNDMGAFLSVSVSALIIVVIFFRNSLKKYYSQQTTSNKQL